MSAPKGQLQDYKEDKILKEEIKIEKKLDIVFDEESEEEEDLTPPKKLREDNP